MANIIWGVGGGLRGRKKNRKKVGLTDVLLQHMEDKHTFIKRRERKAS